MHSESGAVETGPWFSGPVYLNREALANGTNRLRRSPFGSQTQCQSVGQYHFHHFVKVILEEPCRQFTVGVSPITQLELCSRFGQANFHAGSTVLLSSRKWSSQQCAPLDLRADFHSDTGCQWLRDDADVGYIADGNRADPVVGSD